jgi:hypothetical protein
MHESVIAGQNRLQDHTGIYNKQSVTLPAEVNPPNNVRNRSTVGRIPPGRRHGRLLLLGA